MKTSGLDAGSAVLHPLLQLGMPWFALWFRIQCYWGQCESTSEAQQLWCPFSLLEVKLVQVSSPESESSSIFIVADLWTTLDAELTPGCRSKDHSRVFGGISGVFDMFWLPQNIGRLV